MPEGFDYRRWLLAGRRVIEIDQRPIMDSLMQYREVFPYATNVERLAGFSVGWGFHFARTQDRSPPPAGPVGSQNRMSCFLRLSLLSVFRPSRLSK